jgi:hypothetical protein
MQAEDFTALDREADAVDGGRRAEAAVQVFDGNGGAPPPTLSRKGNVLGWLRSSQKR